MNGRRGLVVASLAAVLAAGGLAAGLARGGGDGEAANGAGFTYRDRFYAMSGAEVRADRLGPVLDRAVPVMDTTTDVREVLGIDPGTAVAVYVRDLGGTAAESGAAWLLTSPDADLAADPWGAPELSHAVHDQG